MTEGRKENCKIDRYTNKELEKFLNVLGVKGFSKKANVTIQGIYKNIKKRKGIKKSMWVFPSDA